MDNNTKYGTLVVSLDFEMLWGNISSWTTEGYGQSHVKQVPVVVHKLIELFEKYDVKATVATVGFLMLRDVDDIKHHLPAVTPGYNKEYLRPYHGYLEKIKDQDRGLYFAPDLVNLLNNSPNIEVGTHTYCHYYCWEEGQTLEQFDADLAMAKKVAEEKGILLESIVFPRNQVSDNYLSVCAKYGIKTYRGNAKKYFGETNCWLKALYNKAARLMDAYINWGGNTSYSYDAIDKATLPVNVPASRMLRPYMRKLWFLEGLRLHRIKREMCYAAKHNEVYHIWWHPHNFGADMEKNLSFLEEVLKCYQSSHQQYGMQSMTMKELYNNLIKTE